MWYSKTLTGSTPLRAQYGGRHRDAPAATSSATAASNSPRRPTTWSVSNASKNVARECSQARPRPVRGATSSKPAADAR
jgi:hypothetical protein